MGLKWKPKDVIDSSALPLSTQRLLLCKPSRFPVSASSQQPGRGVRRGRSRSARSANREVGPGGTEPLCGGKVELKLTSHRSSPVPRSLCPCLIPPITSCREVSGVSCRVTGSMGQPPAKMSWRDRWGQGRVLGVLPQAAPLNPPPSPTHQLSPPRPPC